VLCTDVWFDAGGTPQGNDAELCRRGQAPQPPVIHTTDEGPDGGVGAEQADPRTATVMKRWPFPYWTSANLSLNTAPSIGCFRCTRGPPAPQHP
jgi:hypothetical protein